MYRFSSAYTGSLLTVYNGETYLTAGHDNDLYHWQEGQAVNSTPVVNSLIDVMPQLSIKTGTAPGPKILYATRFVGHKYYELKDHLGNVRATISDLRTMQASIASAEVKSYNNYYPLRQAQCTAFGMLMPGRNYSSDDYRYGFNGKEMDNDMRGGTGVTYDYGFRIYDSRIGKFLSVDPLTAKYPYLTPYAFAENCVINGIDLDGGEWKLTIYSPWFAGEFMKANSADDIYRMRQVTYMAMNTKLTGKDLEWYKGQGGIDGGNNYQCAKLTYDKTAPNGVSIYLSTYVGRKMKIEHIDYEFKIFEPDLTTPYYDWKYPVDIRLISNTNPKNDWEGTWDDYYGGYDIIGKTVGTAIEGLDKSFEGSELIGYTRGYGFTIYESTSSEGFSSPSYSNGTGWLKGKFLGMNKFDATPRSFEGKGAETSAGYGPYSYANWSSFDNSGEKTLWHGSTHNLSLDISFLPYSLRLNMKTNTKLIFPIPKNANAK